MAPSRIGGHAFGLEVEAPFPIAGVRPGRDGRVRRRTRLDLVTDSDIEAGWPRSGARTTRRLRFSDGDLALLIEQHDQAGYLVTSPGYGRHHVSPDGSLVRCAPPSVAPAQWHSVLVGQVLPLAATLRGLELLHASALAVDGRLVALSGPSGAGKSTLATGLLLEGATLFTDDVLALEADGDGLIAHPGPGVARLATDAPGLAELIVGGLGSVSGVHVKAQVEVPQEERSLPLAAIYFLEPADAGAPFVIESIIEAEQGSRLLGSTYSLSVQTPERLLRQLDVCARVAHSAGMFSVSVPRGNARRHARLIAEHARGRVLTEV